MYGGDTSSQQQPEREERGTLGGPQIPQGKGATRDEENIEKEQSDSGVHGGGYEECSGSCARGRNFPEAEA